MYVCIYVYPQLMHEITRVSPLCQALLACIILFHFVLYFALTLQPKHPRRAQAAPCIWWSSPPCKLHVLMQSLQRQHQAGGLRYATFLIMPFIGLSDTQVLGDRSESALGSPSCRIFTLLQASCQYPPLLWLMHSQCGAERWGLNREPAPCLLLKKIRPPLNQAHRAPASNAWDGANRKISKQAKETVLQTKLPPSVCLALSEPEKHINNQFLSSTPIYFNN